VTSHQQPSVPFAAQAIPFDEFLASGKLPDGYLSSEYLAQQFVERLVHYVLSVPTGSYTMAQLGQLLEQIDSRTQILFFKRLKETSPDSLKDFAPLYYGFMNEFHDLYLAVENIRDGGSFTCQLYFAHNLSGFPFQNFFISVGQGFHLALLCPI
jgi:hypothetical protein